MLERRSNGGRPSKGDRHAFKTRIAMPVAERLVAEADARGMPWGDYIEAVVAQAHGFDVVLPEKRVDDPQQQELGISA